MKTIMYLITILTLVSFQNSYAAPKVGKRAAARYFQGEVASNESDVANQKVASSIEPLSPEDHFLTFGFSNYVSSDSYKWGQNGKEENVGVAQKEFLKRAKLNSLASLGRYSEDMEDE